MYPAPQCPIHTQVYLSTALKAIRDGIWTRQCILIVSYCAPTASSEVLACSSSPSMAQSHRVFFSSSCVLSLFVAKYPQTWQIIRRQEGFGGARGETIVRGFDFWMGSVYRIWIHIRYSRVGEKLFILALCYIGLQWCWIESKEADCKYNISMIWTLTHKISIQQHWREDEDMENRFGA